MKIGAYPIDEEWLSGFVRLHKRVVVVEELAPVIESAVREVSGTVEVHGKKDGHSPFEGEFSPGLVAGILTSAGITPVVRYPQVTRYRRSRPTAHPLRRMPSPVGILRNTQGFQGRGLPV